MTAAIVDPPASASASDTGFAADRVVRTMATVLAVADLLLLALNLSSALAQTAVLALWWIAASIAAAGLPAVAALVAVRTASPRMLQRVWGAGAVLFVLAFLTVPLALGGARLPATIGMPWLLELAAIAGCAAGIAWPGRRAIAYWLLLSVVLGAIAVLAVDAPLPSKPLGDAARQFVMVAFFMALTFAMRRAGRILDATVRLAVDTARDAARADARRSARRDVSMLIHDDVIVALLGYAAAGSTARTAAEARHALEAIAELERGDATGGDRAPQALAWELQSLTTGADPDAAFDYVTTGEAPIPSAAATALVEASSEALRNSLRHAGPDADRQVRVQIDDDLVEVVVLDDGRGFDPDEVDAARFGVRHGIVERLQAIPGGEALVASRRDFGTAVRLRWVRP